LGIDTVGVFSEADRGALHTRVVDRAICLGGRSPGESYLRGDAVIAAAQSAGADAIHPGYGFLSENAGFAREVEAAGLIWVGPTPEQIELLGDKVAAKQAAVRAGVPTTEAVVVDPAALSDPLTGAAMAATLPVPAMVKAAAGGGGRGMRIVRDRGEFSDVVASASREAAAAFGDGTVFVEPLIERARHVEVQVLADSHGNVVHLGERDCSIQRRHQKVIEEAPSPGIDGDIREALCNGAVNLATEVGYRGAGTVEYLVGTDGTISFLEVNTRLQVEHPVTEAVWGVDLVELQLLVASGAELPFSQHELVPRGHAIEARLVAEDPAAGWMPSTGVIEAFSFDDAHDVRGGYPRRCGIRVDSGVCAGSVVGSDYDSLLAKVIAHGPNRSSVATSLARSLRRADLAGLRTNADTLAAICTERDFTEGDATTEYLDEHPEVTVARGPAGDDRLMQCLVALFVIEDANRSADAVTGFAPSGWRNVATQGQRVTLVDPSAVGEAEAGQSVTFEYSFADAGGILDGHGVAGPRCGEVLVGPVPQPDAEGVLSADTRRVGKVLAERIDPELDGKTERNTDGRETSRREATSTWQVELDGVSQTFEATLTAALGDPMVRVRGTDGRTEWKPAPRFAHHDEAEAATGPVSPLPGSVVSVHVAPGDAAADGDLLVVMEAMKMEHRITARSDVVIAEVRVAVGDKVDAGDVLVTFVD
jgi:propionyl-CoA carboxylase alpha chain